MNSPDFGIILLDAAKTEAALIWTSWPSWSHENPFLWAIPAMMVFGFLRAVRPAKRRTRRR